MEDDRQSIGAAPLSRGDAQRRKAPSKVAPLAALVLTALFAFAVLAATVSAPPLANGSLASAGAAIGLVAVLAICGELLVRRGQTSCTRRARRVSRMERIQSELDRLGLTPREMTVARLVLQHRPYEDIAKECGLSVRTIQFHASNIYHKAYVTRRRDFERLMLAEPDDADEAFERIPRLRADAHGGAQDAQVPNRNVEQQANGRPTPAMTLSAESAASTPLPVKPAAPLSPTTARSRGALRRLRRCRRPGEPSLPQGNSGKTDGRRSRGKEHFVVR